MDLPTLNLAELEAAAIRQALAAAHVNRSEAARLLGVGRSTLYRRLTEMQIDTTDDRDAQPARSGLGSTGA